MTILRTKNLVETYRAKARAKDINELTGRTARPDLTKFVITQMSLNIPLKYDTILIDIGCGDGSFLLKCLENGLNSYKGRLIGILPTTEEVSRVRNHLLQNQKNNQHPISIELGLAEETKIQNSYCDTLVCNGVLHGGGQTIDNVKLALTEFNRITKTGGTIFIGEMPDSDEMAGKNYGDSIIQWLFWVLKNQDFKSFLKRLKQILTALFSKEPFIIAPKNMFYMAPKDFISLLNQHGFQVIKHYKHKEIDVLGNVYESKTRWNYIGIKK